MKRTPNSGGRSYRRPGASSWLLALLLAGSLLSGARAEVFEVRADGSGDYPSIQDAIIAADTGDVIEVYPGRYFENITFYGRRVAVRGVGGPEETVLDGGGKESVVIFRFGESRQATLEGFTIQNGIGSILQSPEIIGTYAAALDLERLEGAEERLGFSTAKLMPPEGATQGRFGGGILCNPGSPTLRNLVVIDNTANFGGGIFGNASSPLIDGCRISGNSAGVGAGMAFETRGPNIQQCLVTDNTAALGGGMSAFRSDFNLHATRFERNLAGEGGALYVIDQSQNPQMHHCILWKNQAGLGSAIRVYYAPLDMRFCVLANNGIPDYDPAAMFYTHGIFSQVKNNIFFQNVTVLPLQCEEESQVQYFCNDFWPQAVPEETCEPWFDNFSLNPRFCGAAAGNFEVRSDSPCLPENSPGSCEQVGPFTEPGCQVPFLDILSLRRKMEALYEERGQSITQ